MRERRPPVRAGWAPRAALAVAALLGLDVAWAVLLPAGHAKPAIVELEPGLRTRVIAERLHAAGLIRSPFWFRALARLEGRPLKAGEYGFTRANLLTVLHAVQRGKVYLHRILVREGDAAEQIELALGREAVCDPVAFRAAVRSRELLRALGVPAAAPSAEGFLFPDSYLIPKGMAPRDVVAMMVRRFFARVPPDLLKQAADRGFKPLALVTFASIVEKEAREPDERPVIAGVFANRLRRGMPLQADPTVLYGLGRWDAHLSLADLRIDSPYNTYLHRGLPPGPICNPGLACLKAAAAPAAVPFLYFVTRKDGSLRHAFSRTLAEHERATRASKARQRPAPSSTPPA